MKGEGTRDLLLTCLWCLVHEEIEDNVAQGCFKKNGHVGNNGVARE